MYSKLLLNKKKIMFILAIGAGALLSSPNVYALEEQAGCYTSGVVFERSDNTLSITSEKVNNVINWKSFDVSENSTVQFDNGLKEHNYLNLIHDTKASEIYGNIEGGNNVYLINPNGFLFGSNSSVNVGNLYISTQALYDVNASDFETKGINPLSIPETNLVGNIVNLGTIQANKVVLEGNNVTLTNNINAISEMVVKARNDISLGIADGDVSEEVNSNQFSTELGDKLFSFLSNNDGNISFQDLFGNQKSDITPYYLVRNVYELQNIQTQFCRKEKKKMKLK